MSISNKANETETQTTTPDREKRALELVNEAIGSIVSGFPGSALHDLRMLKALLEGAEPFKERFWRPEGGTR